jgi:transposase
MRRTNNDIIHHIEELTIENEQLSKENKKLRGKNRELHAENERLRKRLDVLETTLEARINKAVEEAVQKATEPLQAVIAEKDKEIRRLKAQLDKDSSNSSRPSGGNGYKKVPNNREKSGKKQGGQYGHKGFRLNIPENLDELVERGKAEHKIISEVSEGEAYVSDWTIDLKVVTVFTEHRRKPGNPPKIEYGTQLKVIAVYLCVVGLIAVKRLTQFFHEITCGLIPVSKAAIAGFTRDAAKSIDLRGNVQDLLNGQVINTDETPIKTSERPNKDGVLETAEKTTFNAYIRTYSNRLTTVLTASPNKTEESVIADNILTQFHGIVSQDHEAKFYNFGNANSTCGAHLTRELKGLSELYLLTWAAEVRELFLEMNNHKNNDVHIGVTGCEPVLLRTFESRYNELLQAGKSRLLAMPPKSFGYDELRRMINRLDKFKDNYLLFIRNYEAPFTNNQAERDLRHCKTKQKISGCFRSWQGVLDYCNIRSSLDTAKKRGENLFDTLFFLCSHLTPLDCNHECSHSRNKIMW